MLQLFLEHLAIAVMRESFGMTHHSDLPDCKCKNKIEYISFSAIQTPLRLNVRQIIFKVLQNSQHFYMKDYFLSENRNVYFKDDINSLLLSKFFQIVYNFCIIIYALFSLSHVG